MQYFYRDGKDNKIPITTTDIYPFNYEGIDFLAWKKEDSWQVIEVTTGLKIDTTDNKTTKDKAISALESFMIRYSTKRIKDQIQLAYNKLNPPKISNLQVV